MSATRFSIQTTFATSVAAVLLSAAQFAGIDSLATPRAAAPAAARLAQLPLVVVTGSRLDAAETMQLPTVVVTGHAERATSVARSTTPAAAI